MGKQEVEGRKQGIYGREETGGCRSSRSSNLEMEVEGEARQWSSVCERSTRKAGCYRTTAGSRGIQGNHGQSAPLRSDRAMMATAQGRRNPRSRQGRKNASGPNKESSDPWA